MIYPKEMQSVGSPTYRRGNTVLPDQINYFIQYQITLWHRKSDGVCLCNEAPDATMNRISAPRSLMPIDNLQRVLWCHVASGHPKDTIHYHCQIYNVAHHTTDILWAIRQKSRPGSWKEDHKALAYLPLNVSLAQSG